MPDQPYGECWLWPAGTNGTGYPENGRGLIPRQMYEYFICPVPDGMWVLHHCDTPFCVNPFHLFIGTPQDNTDDMIDKGRSNLGRRARLTRGDAEEIVRLREDGVSQTALARQFRVNQSTISRLVTEARGPRQHYAQEMI